ncbi:hypothetical protein NC653_002962 [Populus alba x Populus x berolinensis]|uniref:ABC transporter domain-containing protein n=1 Tax=Populus alba x Populus x berolinensis TaxID=444605 RepID=A0AAD6WJV9_9ROSI|nr:hypothetical protein NC653_002962 [Populus alba x Populus x berolinensis]
MHELGLFHVADCFLGDEESRCISSGERKSVSIGVDMIHDPPILLLDEPTSGLDSTSALQVIELLSSMAKAKRRTVVLLESLEETITTLGFQIPLQLNALELAMEIINTLKDAKSKMYTPTLENNETYSYTIWPQEEIVQTQQGSVYVKVGKDEGGVAERLGLFAFSLSFLLSSTVEALPIYLQERRWIFFSPSLCTGLWGLIHPLLPSHSSHLWCGLLS